MDWLLEFLPRNLDRLSVWIGVLCTLAIYSLLYRENPIYRFFEHMYIGLAAGYSLGPLGVDILYRYWIEPIWIQGYWAWAFVVPYGMYLYFIFSERYGWISRIVIGTLIGASAGCFSKSSVRATCPTQQHAAETALGQRRQPRHDLRDDD
jgi:hypothetical protein